MVIISKTEGKFKLRYYNPGTMTFDFFLQNALRNNLYENY